MDMKLLRSGIVGAVSILLVVGLSGCGVLGGSASQKQEDPTPAKTTEDPGVAIPSKTPEEPKVAEPDYEVTIDEARILKDRDGNDVLAVTYTFTNNSSETTSFGSAVQRQAFQNGVELETSYISPYENEDFDGSGLYKDIKPGGTITAQGAFELDETSVVSIECWQYSLDYSTKIELATRDFSLE